MTNTFTPKQLNITPALGREKAEARLTVYGDRPENFAIKQAWYLVQHTDVTGRMNGEGAIAYRRLSGYQLAKMVCEIANQDLMGADVTAYMYKFLGISLEVAAVEQFLVINNVFDTDIQEYEDELGVMDFLREVEIEGGNPADFLVQKLVGQNLDYSINGSTWIAEYAPIIVNGEVPTPETVATPAPEAAQAEPVASLRFTGGKVTGDDLQPKTSAAFTHLTLPYPQELELRIMHGNDGWIETDEDTNESAIWALHKLLGQGLVEKNYISNGVFRYTLTANGKAQIEHILNTAPVADSAVPVSSEGVSNSAIQVADDEIPFASGMDDSEPVTEEYVYGCMNRPAMYGTVPDGWVDIDNTTAVYQWGTVIYDHPLTREQVKDYDLHPASANTRRFQVGEFVDWCGDKCEVIAHLPYNGYITIGFGIVTCDEKEWDKDMAAWIDSPCIAEPPVNPVWTHNANDMPRPVVTGWRSIHQATWLFAEREGVTGHGRTSRNRANARKRAKNAKTTRNGSTPVMMEKNSVAAANWRNKRNLANAVAMPQPTITGVELLARGIQLVQKPKQMTRFLETRNRRAA